MQEGVSFRMTFAASGPMQPSVMDAVEKCGLGEHVRFLGGFERSSLPDLLAAERYICIRLALGRNEYFIARSHGWWRVSNRESNTCEPIGT